MNTTTHLSTLLARVRATGAGEDEAAHDAAITQAEASIVSAISKAARDWPVNATVSHVGPVEECGDGLYADYSILLSVGPKSAKVGGWRCCGWVLPGASQDLDGSGLRNWGDSQPGFWSQTDSDGQLSGKPHVGPSEYALAVHPGYGRDGGMEVGLGDIVPGLSPEDLETVADHLDMSQAWAPLVGRIEDALAEAIGDVDVGEPDGETIWAELSEPMRDVDDVRTGAWGGYFLVAAKDEVGAIHVSHADDGWQDAVGRAASRAIVAEIDREIAQHDEQ